MEVEGTETIMIRGIFAGRGIKWFYPPHNQPNSLPTGSPQYLFVIVVQFRATAGIVGEVRRSRSPHFVEIRTCRYKEHVGPGEDSDAGYRSAEDLQAWKSKDPLILNQELVAQYRPVIIQEIDDAVEFAEQSPWPERSELLSDVV